MPDTATVALVTGGPLLTNKTGFGNETPWSRRPKVTLSVEDGETLASALTRAGAEMDVELDGGYRLPQTLSYVAFFTPDDEAGLTRRYLYASNLPLVNEPGLVTWRNSIHDATFSQLARAAALGALEGDPYRPYLILQQPAGNGVLADWATVEAVWDAFNYVMAHLDTIGGGVLTLTAAKRLVIDRLARKGRDAKDVIRRRGTSWSARGGTPYEMAEWLGDRAWSSATLARLLDCSEPEAKALLWAFGFARTKTGVWEKDVDEEAKLLNEVVWLGLRLMPPDRRDPALLRVLAEHAREYVETGATRPIDWQELDWLAEPPPVWRSPVWHLRAFVARIRDGMR